MKSFRRKLLAVVLSLALVFSVTAPSFAADITSNKTKTLNSTGSSKTVKAVKNDGLVLGINNVAENCIKERIIDPTPGYTSGDYTVWAVNAANKVVAINGLDDWNAKYVNNAMANINNVSGAGSFAHLILGLNSAGVDVKADFEGVDLYDKMLGDAEDVKGYYAGTPTTVLMAINAGDYDLSSRTEGVTSIDEIIEYIASYTKDNKFGYEWEGVWYDDYDSAGMALQALAPYVDSNSTAKTLVEANTEMIVSGLEESGTVNYNNACSSAQVLLGLIAVGYDVEALVSSHGNTLADGVMSFYSSEKGIFEQQDENITTDQCLLAVSLYADSIRGLKGVKLLGNFGTVKAKSKTTSVILSSFNVSGADSYSISISGKSNSGFKIIANLKTASYTAKKLTPGKVYYFKITAKNKVFSKTSKVVKVETKVAAPKTVKAAAGKKKVTVKFSKSTNAKKYYLYRSTKKTKGFKKIAALKKVKYVDKKVKKGKVYYYKVKAVKSSSNISGFSKVVKTKKVK